MSGLEANPHTSCGCRLGPGDVIPARIQHSGHELLRRHRHDTPFAAVVLSGSYVEAGDTGLHRVGPGDVIVHRPFESHLDRFSASGAEVLTLALTDDLPSGALRRTNDPDAIARLAERDGTEAAQALMLDSLAVSVTPNDWPELLAADLLADPGLSIACWARQRLLHPGSVGRGFRQQFGITAAGFRAAARGLRAVHAIRTTRGDAVRHRRCRGLCRPGAHDQSYQCNHRQSARETSRDLSRCLKVSIPQRRAGLRRDDHSR